jgi:predicted RNA binding protein YcfA (HicA-like mRNA interferase family)
LAAAGLPLARCDQQRRNESMPPKIKVLIAELEGAGFVNRDGKGSHRNFVHLGAQKPIMISAKLGDDAKHYQIRAVRLALEALEK